MIEESIRERAVLFAQMWNQATSQYPIYVLDGSWPSIGVIDLLLFPLREKESLTEADEAFIEGAAAYLALFVYECWKKLDDDYKVSVDLQTSPSLDFIVCLAGEGVLLADNSQRFVAMKALLVDALKNPPNPMPVYREFSLPLTPTSNRISALIAGICAFSSPHIKGPRVAISEATQRKIESPVSSFFAQGLVERYEQVAPHEEMLLQKSFFVPGMSLPPDYHDGTPPLVKHVHPIFMLLSQGKVGNDAEAIALHLARSTDDLVSKVGYALVAGLQRAMPNESVSVLAESLGLRAFQAHSAVIHLRHLQDIEGDWFEMLQQGEVKAAQFWLDVDYHLGLAPAIVFPAISYLDSPMFRPLLHVLKQGSLERASTILNLEEALGIYPPGMLVQFVKYAFSMQNLEAAERILVELESRDLGADVESRFSLLVYRGNMQYLQEQFSEALNSWDKALAMPTQDRRLRNEVAFRYAEVSLVSGNVERVVTLLASLPDVDSSFYLQVVKATTAGVMQEYETLEKVTARLYKLVPNNHEVLSLIRAQLQSNAPS